MVSFSSISKRLGDIRLRCQDSTATDALSFAHFSSAFEIPVAHWTALVGRDEPMLTVPYLAALEQHPVAGLRFHYVLAYEGTVPVAAFYFQEFDLRINKIDRNVDTDRVADAGSLIAQAKDVMARGLEQFGVRMLVLGNVYLTGQYGARFAPGVSDQRKAETVIKAVERVMKDDLSGKKIRTVLYKDLTDDLFNAIHASDDDLIPFHIQPQMVIDLRQWKSMDEYLDAFSSKYRVRAKSAFKKFEQISHRQLTLADMQQHEARMWQLYSEVEGKADFVMAALPRGYFTDLKMALDDRYRVVGYFSADGTMVGFYSTLLGTTRNMAHYIGMDYAVNQECALYLNILYHQVADGIADGVREVDTGRTALEIKSTVGCEPHQLRLLARHTNGVTNRIARMFLSNLRQPEWVQRRPFKEQVEVEG